MTLNLVKTAADYLRDNPEQRFNAREIAEWIFVTYPDECREKKERSKATVMPLTDENALIQQIIAEIGSQRPRLQRNYPQIKTTEGRPRKYYFTTKSDVDAVSEAEYVDSALAVTVVSNAHITEHNLYPKLSEYLWSELDLYSKRINERRSSNTRGSGGNRWLYPDIVAMEDLSSEWNPELLPVSRTPG